MSALAGGQELTPAVHHRIHRRDFILRFTAGIATPSREDKIGIQFRQTFRTDINAPTRRNTVDKFRESETSIA